MGADTETVTGWFVLNSGFKVYGRCPACNSPHISYHKVRRQGLRGISAASQGITPVCIDCGKGLPTRAPKDQKQPNFKKKSARVNS